MKVKTITVQRTLKTCGEELYLEDELNKIGYENVLQIFQCDDYFTIIYKEEERESEARKKLWK
jgi:hypothetical protein